MGIARYVQKPEATKLKITGINAFSAGDFMGRDDDAIITFYDRDLRHYRKLVIRSNLLCGAILYGDTQDGAWFFDLIQAQTDISAWRDRLIFGKDFCVESDSIPSIPVAA